MCPSAVSAATDAARNDDLDLVGAERSARVAFAVRVWRAVDVLRELEHAAIRFGLRRRAIDAKWRGLHVQVSVDVEGAPNALHAYERAVRALCAEPAV
jgi:hypothetical protein